MAFKDDITLSEAKYQINDWLLDELGLDADDFTSKVDNVSSEKELSECVNGFYSHFKSKNPDVAKKLFTFWTNLNK